MVINIKLADLTVDSIVFAENISYKLPEDAEEMWQTWMKRNEKQEEIVKRNKALSSVYGVISHIAKPIEEIRKHMMIYYRIYKSIENITKLIRNKELLRERLSIRKLYQSYILKPKKDSQLAIWLQDMNAESILSKAHTDQMAMSTMLTRQWVLLGTMFTFLKNWKPIGGALDGLKPKVPTKKPGPTKTPKERPVPKSWWERFKDFARALWNRIKGAWKWLVGKFSKIARIALKLASFVKPVIRAGIESLKLTIARLTLRIRSGIARVFPRLAADIFRKGVVRAIGGAIRSTIKGFGAAALKVAKMAGRGLGRLVVGAGASRLAVAGTTTAVIAAVATAAITSFNLFTKVVPKAAEDIRRGQWDIRNLNWGAALDSVKSLFGLQEGGEIERGGIAYLHEGEVIIPKFATVPQHITVNIGKVKIMNEADIRTTATRIVNEVIQRAETW